MKIIPVVEASYAPGMVRGENVGIESWLEIQKNLRERAHAAVEKAAAVLRKALRSHSYGMVERFLLGSSPITG